MKSVRVALAVAGTALILGACGDFQSEPLSPDDPSMSTFEVARVHIIKFGPHLEKFYFTASATGGTLLDDYIALTPGYFREKDIWEETDPTASPSQVTITELPKTGFQLDSIVYIRNYTTGDPAEVVQVITDASSITVDVDYTTGAWIKFYNSEIPHGMEGCTPGYWKQPQHFGAWEGYTPDQAFSSVFEDAFPGKTLLDVLEEGGGDLDALGRHTVAALLNAASGDVDYYLGEQEVIEAFNEVYPDGDYEGLKDEFEEKNELGCPLGEE